MKPARSARPSARERLLAAADELFYAEGVQSVGIDRVIERAGVAKASLYNCFASKEDLVAAYLDSRRDRLTRHLSEAAARGRTPRGRILAVFDAQAELVAEPGFNGCAFAAATTEAAHGRMIDDAAAGYRAWVRQLFTDLAAEGGAAEPDSLGRQLHLVYDGISQTGRMDHDPGTAAAGRRAVESLLDANLPQP